MALEAEGGVVEDEPLVGVRIRRAFDGLRCWRKTRLTDGSLTLVGELVWGLDRRDCATGCAPYRK